MRQHLVVKSDRLGVDTRNAERVRDLQSRVGLRQLPEATEQPFGAAPREHDLARVLEPQRRARDHRQLALLLPLRDDRQLVLAAFDRGAAMLRERTQEAARSGRRADRRAELHQALVQRARCVPVGQRRHQLARVLPQRLATGSALDVVLDREHARQHARDVAVDERRLLAKRDRCDRTGGVRPDARHAAQLAGPARQPALADRLCTGVEIARARVVAKASPRGEHVVERCVGERAHRRKLRHPALPVRDHGLHARLLQHHLADPDRVRVARAPPRQVPAHLFVVRDHRER
jgi:hypothetical protein